MKHDDEDFRAKCLRVATICERAGMQEAADVLREAENRLFKVECGVPIRRLNRDAIVDVPEIEITKRS